MFPPSFDYTTNSLARTFFMKFWFTVSCVILRGGVSLRVHHAKVRVAVQRGQNA